MVCELEKIVHDYKKAMYSRTMQVVEWITTKDINCGDNILREWKTGRMKVDGISFESLLDNHHGMEYLEALYTDVFPYKTLVSKSDGLYVRISMSKDRSQWKYILDRYMEYLYGNVYPNMISDEYLNKILIPFTGIANNVALI